MRMRCLRRLKYFPAAVSGIAAKIVARPFPPLRNFSSILASCLILFLLIGCMRHEPRADIVIVNDMEPETLDPGLVLGLADMRIVSALFEGLTRNDPITSDPIPGLAERWEMSPDGRTYTFHLRTNLVWSTGGPITADDVVYS